MCCDFLDREEEINLCAECQDKVEVKMLRGDDKGPEFFDKCLKEKLHYCRSSYDDEKGITIALEKEKRAVTKEKKRALGGAAAGASPTKKPKNMMAFLLDETVEEVKQEERKKKEAKEAAAEAQDWYEQDSGLTHSFQSIQNNSKAFQRTS